MFEKKLASIICAKLEVQPTNSQQVAIDEISKFLFNDNQHSIFLLRGYAGTGKTLLISTLVQVLEQFRLKTDLMAPTGRAAKVLSVYAQKPAHTIHKRIYKQLASSDGFGRFVLDYNKASNTLFIVDEASMISNSQGEFALFGSGLLLDDLLEYVYNGKNCRLMLVGDTAQLPPVGLGISPALDKKVLDEYNFTVFSSVLNDVVRQTEHSGILYNATAMRLHIKQQRANDFFPIKLSGFTDVVSINGDELIEAISSSYGKYGESETIVVTRSNKRANKYNQGIRNQILWRESELEKGDLLMVVKNNYYWKSPDLEFEFIANGDIAKVKRVRRVEEQYGFRFADVTLQFIDYADVEIDCKIILDTLTIDSAALGNEESKRLFESVQLDYMHIVNKKNRWKEIREDQYFNALQVKYAYAVTCHKAQGGQWESVFIDHGFLTKEMMNVEYYRWFYTAFTRSKSKLYLVNFMKEFFDK